MRCPFCGAENIEGSELCDQCQHSLTDMSLRQASTGRLAAPGCLVVQGARPARGQQLVVSQPYPELHVHQ